MMNPLFREIDLPFTLRVSRPSPGFCSLQEEYRHLEEQLPFFNLRFPLSPIAPPAFRALKDDSELRLLQRRYRKAHREMLRIYGEQDFLTVFLKLLMEQDGKRFKDLTAGFPR